MSRIKVDFKELKDWEKKLERLNKRQVQVFIEMVCKELAARLLTKAIKRTPVGIYPSGSGKTGGTLRRGWTAETEEEASSGDLKTDAKAYAQSLPIEKIGNMYRVEIINPVRYASYVEFGHRTINHKGWVEGRFFLTISEQELERSSPKVIEKLLARFLGECFG